MSDQPAEFPERDGARQLRNMVREAITNAYYNARNTGETMEFAADRATDSVLLIIESVDANARAYGKVVGQLEAINEIMLEREDHEEPFIVNLRNDVEARLAAAQ